MKTILKIIVLGFAFFLLFRSCVPFLGGTNPLVGQPAPDFTLEVLDGQEVNMAQFRNNQPAIIFFWATWCPHCRTALKKLSQRRDRMEKEGIKVVLVDVGESPPKVSQYIASNNISYTVFLDQDSELARTYHIIGVPTFFFLSKEGVVVAVDHDLPEEYGEILLGFLPQFRDIVDKVSFKS